MNVSGRCVCMCLGDEFLKLNFDFVFSFSIFNLCTEYIKHYDMYTHLSVNPIEVHNVYLNQ